MDGVAVVDVTTGVVTDVALSEGLVPGFATGPNGVIIASRAGMVVALGPDGTELARRHISQRCVGVVGADQNSAIVATKGEVVCMKFHEGSLADSV